MDNKTMDSTAFHLNDISKFCPYLAVHTVFPLQNQLVWWRLSQLALFIMRIIRNIYIYNERKLQRNFNTTVDGSYYYHRVLKVHFTMYFRTKVMWRG